MLIKKLCILITAGAVFLCGCHGEKAAQKPAEPGVVDYMTGAEQLKTYQKAKEKIQDINKALEKRYQE